jgi:glycosyltransferase involved in cell wall biosynthesis
MKVLFFTREDRNLSGARVRCYGLAAELKKYGVETRVFSFARQLGAKCAERESEMGLAEKLKYNFQALRYLRKEAGRGTIIFTQRLNYHTLAPFLASRTGKRKFIFDCDDWNIRENPVYYLGFYPSSKMEYLTRKLACYSDLCVASSGFLKDYLLKFNPKVCYLPTGVDLTAFSPDPEKKPGPKVVFSWIGTAYHREMGDNLRFILDIFSELAEKHGNIFLSLAGEGRYFNETMLRVGACKHKERIFNRGWIPFERIPSYLSGIDIGLLPLIQNTRFNLAKSPTKLFEYMAMAKPAVSSGIGEAAGIIRDGIDGFLARGREEFTEKMDKLIRDPSLRLQMGAEARRTVEEKYSLDVLGRKLFEEIRKI